MIFQDGDTILDLGANVGIFSIPLAKMYPTIKIYAFEPLKVNYDNLVLNLAVNNVNNVTPFNYAITKNDRDVIAISSKTMSGGAHVINQDLMNNFILETDNFIINICKSISLKNIFENFSIDRVKLLKIDVEGFEYEIIKSNWSKLKNVEYLSDEFHFYGGEDLKQVCQEFFKPDKLKISCIAENIRQPKDLKTILETMVNWEVDITNDLKVLTR